MEIGRGEIIHGYLGSATSGCLRKYAVLCVMTLYVLVEC
jgi:hypothetical protein